MPKAENFKTWAEGFQAVILGLGVLGGAAWAFWVFETELHRENAQARLAKLENELNLQPAVGLELTSSQLNAPGKACRFIVVKLKATNNGKENAVIILPNDPIRVTKVSYSKDGINFKQPTTAQLQSIHVNDTSGVVTQPIEDFSLLVGQSKIFHFLVKVAGPGLYRIDFRARPGKNVIAARQKLNEVEKAKEEKLHIWYTNHYIAIE